MQSYWQTSTVCQMKVLEEMLAVGFPLSKGKKMTKNNKTKQQTLPFSNGVYSTA